MVLGFTVFFDVKLNLRATASDNRWPPLVSRQYIVLFFQTIKSGLKFRSWSNLPLLGF